MVNKILQEKCLRIEKSIKAKNTLLIIGVHIHNKIETKTCNKIRDEQQSFRKNRLTTNAKIVGKLIIKVL